MTKEKLNEAQMLFEQIRSRSVSIEKRKKDIEILKSKFTSHEFEKDLIDVKITKGSEQFIIYISPDYVLKKIEEELYINENLLKRAKLLFDNL